MVQERPQPSVPLQGYLPQRPARYTLTESDIIKNPVESKKKVGYIPDRPYLYDKLTAREFLQFVGQLYELTPAHIRERGDDTVKRTRSD